MDDFLDVMRHPGASELLFIGMKFDILEMFEEYWSNMEGYSDAPHMQRQEYLDYLPKELDLLYLDMMKLYRQLSRHVNVVEITCIYIMIPDDIITIDFKIKP